MEDDKKFRASIFDVLERMIERMILDLNEVLGMERRVVTPLTHVIDRDDCVEIVFELLECRDSKPFVKIGDGKVIVRASGENVCLKSVEIPPNLDTSRASVRNLGDLLIVKIPKKR